MARIKPFLAAAGLIISATPGFAMSCSPLVWPNENGEFDFPDTIWDYADSLIEAYSSRPEGSFLVFGNFDRQSDTPLWHEIEGVLYPEIPADVSPEDWWGTYSVAEFSYDDLIHFDGVRINAEQMEPFSATNTVATFIISNDGYWAFWPGQDGPNFGFMTPLPNGALQIEAIACLNAIQPFGDLTLRFLNTAEICIETGNCTRP